MTDVKKVTDDPSGSDNTGAVEKDMQHIGVIKGGEVLGSPKEAHAEHSGQNSPRKNPGNSGDLADNIEKELPSSVVEGIKKR